MTKTLYILRGPPGVGKSHYVGRIAPAAQQVVVCSADDYFERDGEYVFDAEKLPEAHTECLGKVISAMQSGCENIAVDNTNTRRWEYDNYVLLAQLAGYRVQIVEIMPETVEEMRKCAARNQHGVPAAAIAAMVMRFEHDPRAVRLPMSLAQKLSEQRFAAVVTVPLAALSRQKREEKSYE